jgi:hypothetical protein
MQPPPEPPWRQIKPDVIFTGAGRQFVEAGPEDLDPNRAWTIRSALLARRFAADSDVPPRIAAYRSDAEVMGEDDSYAAEAADSAALAATGDAASETAATASEPVDKPTADEPAEGAVVL